MEGSSCKLSAAQRLKLGVMRSTWLRMLSSFFMLTNQIPARPGSLRPVVLRGRHDEMESLQARGRAAWGLPELGGFLSWAYRSFQGKDSKQVELN